MTNQTTSSNTNRRHAAIGVTAGVLGGGAIGLLLGVPTLTSAASDTSTTDSAVVALQDDGSTDGTAGADDRPEAGTHLRELLQALVDDGTITAEQADAVTQHLVENRPERGEGGRHGRRGPGFDGEVVAGLLGIDVDTLRTELRAGSSIADIAEANGVDVDVVVQALVDEAEAHLDLAVESGRLTEDEAADRLADLAERITDRVNRTPGG